MHHVTSCRLVGPSRLWLEFENGLNGEIEVGDYVSFTGVFAPLANAEEFALVEVDKEAGTICWPWGADLAPDFLYAIVAGESLVPFMPSKESERLKQLYLFTDATSEFINTIELLDDLLNRVQSKPALWKWVLFALHDAAHCAMLSCLETYDTITSRGRGRHQDRFVEGLHSTPPRFEDVPTAGFIDLFSRIQDTACMRKTVYSRAMVPSERVCHSVRFAHDVRCRFAHLSSGRHILHLPSLVNAMADLLSVIEFLVRESGCMGYSDEYSSDRANPILDRVRQQLTLLASALATLEGAGHLESISGAPS